MAVERGETPGFSPDLIKWIGNHHANPAFANMSDEQAQEIADAINAPFPGEEPSIGTLSPAFGPGERPTATQYFSAVTRHLQAARESSDPAYKADSIERAAAYSQEILTLPAEELAQVGSVILQMNETNPSVARDSLRVFRGTHVL